MFILLWFPNPDVRVSCRYKNCSQILILQVCIIFVRRCVYVQEEKKCVMLIVWHSFQKSEVHVIFYDFERVEIKDLKIFIFLEKYFIESPFLLKCSRSLHFTIEWTLGEIPQTRTSLSAKAYVLLMLIKVKMYLMRRCFKYKETYFCHKYMPAVLCLNLDKFVLHVN